MDYFELRPPPDLTNVIGLSIGLHHGLPLRSDGTIAAWGDNQNEQVAVPPQLRDGVEMAGGGFPGVELTRSGVVWAWGGRFISEAAARVPPDVGVVVAIPGGQLPRGSSIDRCKAACGASRGN